MRVALDTTILASAEGVGDAARQERAAGLIAALPESDVVLPVQALSELTLLLLKAGRTSAEARTAVLEWRRLYRVQDTTDAVFLAALDLVAMRKFPMWDAIILAAAAEAGCEVLLSEDMLHGRSWRGVTIVDPFVEPAHPLLAALSRTRP